MLEEVDEALEVLEHDDEQVFCEARRKAFETRAARQEFTREYSAARAIAFPKAKAKAKAAPKAAAGGGGWRGPGAGTPELPTP